MGKSYRGVGLFHSFWVPPVFLGLCWDLGHSFHSGNSCGLSPDIEGLSQRLYSQEGAAEEEQTVVLVNLLNKSRRKEEILEELAEKMKITSQYRVITERSMYQRRNLEREVFSPQEIKRQALSSEPLDTFILKPLYTRKELKKFWQENEENGVFCATQNTVNSMEDLEKLFFIWQEATELSESGQEITIGEEFENTEGFRFSGLTIKEK